MSEEELRGILAGFEISKEIDEYFDVTRSIHQIMGDYTYHALTAIDGVKATKPDATFYLLADFNAFAPDLQKAKIIAEQMVAKHPGQRIGHEFLEFINKNMP